MVYQFPICQKKYILINLINLYYNIIMSYHSEQILQDRHSNKNIEYPTYFMFQFVDYIIFNLGIKFIMKRFSKKPSAFMAYIILCIFVFGVHVFYYLYTKQQNIYELMNINRCFTEEQLEFSYKKLSKRRNDIYDVSYKMLKQKNRRELYDKQFSLDQRLYRSGIDVNLVFSITIGYFLHLLILISQLKEEGDAKAKKWIILTTIIICLYELSMVIKYQNTPDMLDYLFPQLTIFERGEVFKMITTPILYSFTNFFSLFEINIEDQVIKNQQIMYQMLKAQRNKIDEKHTQRIDILLKDIITNTNEFLQEADICQFKQLKNWFNYMEIKDQPQEKIPEASKINIETRLPPLLLIEENKDFTFKMYEQYLKHKENKKKEKEGKTKLKKLFDYVVYGILIYVLLNKH